jgi:GGDEF domain-containing protein
MDKRFSWVFLLVSGAFFVFIVGLTGYRIEDTRKRNSAAAHERIAALAAKAQSLRNGAGAYTVPAFKKNMRDVFDSEPRLLLLSIHSERDGILYMVARNRALLKEPTAIAPDWRGKPLYQISQGYEALLSVALQGGETEATLDTLFVIMGREDLYPVVRDDLYLFLAFVLVCGVVILIATSVQQDAMDARARVGAPAGGPMHGGFRVAEEPAASRGHTEAGRAFTSPRTGLVWGEYLPPRLRAELSRAASADLDIALAHIRIDEPFADGKLPIVYSEIARMLKEYFPLHDLIFETGDDSCTLLMPDSDVDAAVRSLDEFRRKAAAAEVEGRQRTVSIGVSSRGGRLIDDATLMEEVEISLAKASREGGNQVVGFRADPARFRDALSAART